MIVLDGLLGRPRITGTVFLWSHRVDHLRSPNKPLPVQTKLHNVAAQGLRSELDANDRQMLAIR